MKSDNKPFFTVVVPVYNHEKYIAAALDSLLAQTDSDWEACVVNDGSTDATPAIIDDYARRDSRIRVFHKPNGGQPTALNRGICESLGTWICWLSSDDLFEPGKLAIHREWILRQPETRFFFSGFRSLMDDTGEVNDADFGAVPDDKGWQLLTLLTYNFINGISICVHREVFDKTGLFNEAYRYGQDYDFYLRSLGHFPATYIPERTCIGRTHATQYSLTQNSAMFFECARVAIDFVNHSSLDAMAPRGMLEDPSSAFRVVDRVLDIALSQHALLYRLGQHPALMARVLEWITALPAGRQKDGLLAHVIERVRMGFTVNRKTGWDVLCRAASIAAEGESRKIAYRPVAVADVATVQYCRLIRENPVEADHLRKYIGRCFIEQLAHFDNADRVFLNVGGAVPCGDSSRNGEEPSEILLLGDKDTDQERELLRMANFLIEGGHRVLRLVIGGWKFGFDSGGYVLGVNDGFRLAVTVCSLPSPDSVVAIRRFRAMRWPLGCGPVSLLASDSDANENKTTSTRNYRAPSRWVRSALMLAGKVKRMIRCPPKVLCLGLK